VIYSVVYIQGERNGRNKRNYVYYHGHESVWIKEKSTNKMHLIQNWRDTDVLEATRELAIKLST